MLCSKSVRHWIGRRGKSLRDASKAAGLDPSQLSRILNRRGGNLRLDQAEKLAAFLEIHIDALVPSYGPFWRPLPWSAFQEIRQYQQEVANSKSVLTLTQGIDSYLIEPDLVDWTGGVWLKTDGWNDQMVTLIEYTRRQRSDYSNAVHYMVCPMAWVKGAAKHLPVSAALLRAVLADRQEVTAVGFVDDWRSFARAVRSCSPVLAGGWDKIAIMDDRICIIRPNRHTYWISEHHSTIRNLRAHLEILSGKFVQYEFASGLDSDPTSLRATARHASTVISLALS